MQRLVLAVVLWSCAGAIAAEPKPYPNHRDLMIVRTDTGEFRSVQTRADWELRRQHILQGMQEAMGKFPDASQRCPLDVEVVSEESTPNYLRRKIRFTPEPGGDRVPAWLLIPHAALGKPKSAGAMLCLHQTTTIGKDEPVGFGGKPNLRYAQELADHGWICIAPDYPSFGEYPFDFEKARDKYISGSMKAIWNNSRAVDLLLTLPEVDPDRLGVVGHSLGGHNALFTAVFEPRLQAVITSSGWTPFHDYYQGKVAGWTSDRYMPLIRTKYQLDPSQIPFDFYEVLAVIAPRAIFSCSPEHDDNFEVAGVRKAEIEVRKVYALYDALDRFRVDTPNAPHTFPPETRFASYEWLAKQLPAK